MVCGSTTAVTASGETSSASSGSGTGEWSTGGRAGAGGSSLSGRGRGRGAWRDLLRGILAVAGEGAQPGGQHRIVLPWMVEQLDAHSPQFVHELTPIGDAHLRVARGAGRDQRIQVVGDEARIPQLAEFCRWGGDIDVHVCVGDLVVVLAYVRFLARQQLEQHDPGGVDVAA